MAIGAPGYSLDRVFTYSYNSTYGKRIYIYPNWGSQYSNAVNLPDQTPVTLGYLRASGLVTIASTTSTQEADDPMAITKEGVEESPLTKIPQVPPLLPEVVWNCRVPG